MAQPLSNQTIFHIIAIGKNEWVSSERGQQNQNAIELSEGETKTNNARFRLLVTFAEAEIM